MLSRTQARSWGWMAVLALCAALVVALSLKVHAVRSEVLLAERQLIALKRETMLLETEFQTRASQAQLAEWNSVEFGYVAPRARQFLEAERQLASFGQGPLPGAPPPLRLASAEGAGEGAAAPGGPAQMRSPVSGAPVTLAAVEAEAGAGAVFAEAFGTFLIEASPIRPARAEPPRAASPAGAGE